MHLPVVGLYSSEQRVNNLLVRLQERAVQYIDNNVNKTQESDNPCKLTPSTLDSCSYRFKMYLKAENMPFHMVKTVFKYSF